MATPAHELIQATTLTSQTSTVSFSSIPATDSNGEPFRDLFLVVHAAITQATTRELRITFNGNNSSVYNINWARGDANTKSTNNYVNSAMAFDVAGYLTNDYVSTLTYKILDFRASRWKTAFYFGGNTTQSHGFGACLFRDTNPITSMTLDPDNTFTVGSSFKLFGIVG